jgi:uncharacterized protein with ATP-grasp and redox domains
MINNLKELQNAVNLAKNQIELAEKSVNLAMDKLISETSPEQYKQIQSTIVNIKGIMKDAKQGKNVDKEIEKIAKVFNNGRRDT